MGVPETILGGTLIKEPDGTWAWMDGTPEPRVRTTALAYWAPNFRVTTYGYGSYVEIPQQWRELYHWDGSPETEAAVVGLIEAHGIKKRVFAERSPSGEHYRKTRPGWLVPIEEWDAVMSEPAGVTWDRKEEADILAKARSFGWAPETTR